MDVEDIGKLIEVICQQPLPPEKEVPQSLVKEAQIALSIKSEIRKEESLGEQVPLSCPSCGGPLWKINDSSMERYRCHVGHAFSQEAMLAGPNNQLEETLWVALRTLEEKRILLQRMAETYSEKGFTTLSASYKNKAEEVTEHIDRLRDVMKLND
jgi:two-component system chemotaxis response regulator CheB